MLGTRQSMCLAVLHTSNVILSFKYERHENALICDLYGFYVSCPDNCAAHFAAGAHCALQPGVNIMPRTYPFFWLILQNIPPLSTCSPADLHGGVVPGAGGAGLLHRLLHAGAGQPQQRPRPRARAQRRVVVSRVRVVSQAEGAAKMFQIDGNNAFKFLCNRKQKAL